MKLYALIVFTDPNGDDHQVGDGFGFDTDTPEGEAEAAKMIDYGMASKTAPKSQKTASEGDGQRAPRRKG